MNKINLPEEKVLKEEELESLMNLYKTINDLIEYLRKNILDLKEEQENE